MITETQIALVQSSFRHVLPIADAAGLLFYERVFTLAPGHPGAVRRRHRARRRSGRWRR